MFNILKVENVTKKYQAKNGEIEALNNINFEIKEGEFVLVDVENPHYCLLLLD